MQSVFITGTDTGIGKTLVSSLIIRQMVDSGLRAAGMKPVASGARYIDGQWRNEDALELIAAANVTAAYEQVNPYCYEPAIAPHIAAQLAAQPIQLQRISQAYAQLSESADVVVVEGVGGWAVPIDDALSMVDVVVELNLPVIMVVGMRLGCLNHASLTAKAIQSRGIRLVGWVANILEPELPYLEQNIETLISILPAPLLGRVPYLDDAVGLVWDSVRLDLGLLD